MSEQSSLMPDEPARSRKGGRKRRGDHEIWMRRVPDETQQFWRLFDKWHKTRDYDTEEMARKNLKDMERKWNARYAAILRFVINKPRWEFIYVGPGDPKPQD